MVEASLSVADLVAALDAIAPPALAEDWDNVGLLVGDPAARAVRVLLCIDYTRAVADERRAGGFDAVVAYHPVIFQPLRRLVAGSLVHEAARDGVAIYSPHTALDVAVGGTNDVLADALGLTTRAPLRPHRSLPEHGIGRVGHRPAITRAALLAELKTTLSVPALLIAGPRDGEVTKLACCAGACGDCLDDAITAGAELYLTGELRHHDALKAAAAGLTVVCALHSNSERRTLARLAARLTVALPGMTFVESAADRDPFTIV